MARIARVVVPGHPHHITQRGNRRQQTFFGEGDYRGYIDLMAEECARFGVEIWAYCLMPNHVHLIAVPSSVDGLRLAFGEAHRRYTSIVNLREGWRGHLWQGRFASFVMDEAYLLAAARYIELNPVEAALVKRPQDYRWSSARAHRAGKDDRLVKVGPLLARVPNWPSLIEAEEPGRSDLFRKHESTGRPLGGSEFIDRLERTLGRSLRLGRPGRKPNALVRPLGGELSMVSPN